MALETATYIEDLVSANPTGTDGKSQGDNHLRLIKSVLKTQFPNLGQAAVTATAAQLNGIFSNNSLIPTGMIAMWSGAVASVPTGWAICDGTNGTPNLVGRFIIGSKTNSGATYDIGDTGGSANINIGSTDAHVLTTNQIPSHSHTHKMTQWVGGDDAAGAQGGKMLIANRNLVSGDRAVDGSYLTSTGGGAGHSHTIANQVGANLPPYYALAYIMKL